MHISLSHMHLTCLSETILQHNGKLFLEIVIFPELEQLTKMKF